MHETLEMDPGYLFMKMIIGWVYTCKGDLERGTEILEEVAALVGDNDPRASAWVAHVYARSGRTEEARAIFEELQEASRQRYVSPCSMALIPLGLGDEEQGFEWLERAFEMRDGDLFLLNVWPNFDSVRSAPRFLDLRRRMNFRDTV